MSANRVQPEQGPAAASKPSGRPRVAVIGGGCSGLVSAYLLEGDDEVVLYEKSYRVGGHADTIDVQKDGKTIAVVDSAADFLPSEKYYQDFFRLLDILAVGLYEQPAGVTYFEREKPGQRGMMVLPPPVLINGTRLATSVAELGKAIGLFRCLLRGQLMVDKNDLTTSVEEMLDRLPFADKEKKAFLLSVLNGMSPGPTKAAARQGIASDVFCYTGQFLTKPLTATVMHCNGGLQGYVKVLVSRLRSTLIHLNTAVESIQRLEDGRYQVTAAGQPPGIFDHLVVATEAVYAQELLQSIPAASAFCEALAGVTGYATTIALHGDTSFMPRNKDEWSNINIYPDGDEVVVSEYRAWEKSTPDAPVFKTWVTNSSRQPAEDKTYKISHYWHPHTDRPFFEAQKKLAAVNGQNGIWLAGTYTNGFPSHNTAVVSAITVAESLAPKAPRLLQLLERPGAGDRGTGCCGACACCCCCCCCCPELA